MTDEQQGGTAPAPEATASSETPASEETVAAIAVADEPAAPETRPPSRRRAAQPEAEAAAEPAAAEARARGRRAPEAAAEAAADAPQPDAVAEAAPMPEAEPPRRPSPPPRPSRAPEAAEAPADAPAAAATEDDVVDAPPAAEERGGRGPGRRRARPAPSRRRWRSCSPSRTPTSRASSTATSSKARSSGSTRTRSWSTSARSPRAWSATASSTAATPSRSRSSTSATSSSCTSSSPRAPEGHVVLSLRRAGLERKWRSMQELFEAGTIIDAPVIDHNKGGLIVDCGIRGFVPISQIVDFPRRPQNEQPRDAAQEIAEKLQPYIGRKLRLKILEVNRKANRLILSEKVALYEERREKRDELFSSLQVGQKVTGSVRSIAPFGIFIDLGGIDGLVHKSELSWNKVNNPEAGYKVGDEVEAEVIDINHERGRISLSIRRLQPDPWESTVADFKVGDVIDGTVTKLVNFGAFVRVREGLEGLIHISELSHQRVAHPGDVVHEGQVLKLKIISLDSERHRLGLSLKQAEEPPVRPTPGARASTPVPPASAAPAPRAPRAPGPRLRAVGRPDRAGGRDRHDPRRRVRPGPQPAGRRRGRGRARRRGRRGRRAAAEAAAEAVAEAAERRRGRRGRGRRRGRRGREAVADAEVAAEAVAEAERPPRPRSRRGRGRGGRRGRGRSPTRPSRRGRGRRGGRGRRRAAVAEEAAESRRRGRGRRGGRRGRGRRRGGRRGRGRAETAARPPRSPRPRRTLEAEAAAEVAERRARGHRGRGAAKAVTADGADRSRTRLERRPAGTPAGRFDSFTGTAARSVHPGGRR